MKREVIVAVAAGIAALAVGGGAFALARVTRPQTGRPGPPDDPAWPVERIRTGRPDVELSVTHSETRVLADQGWRSVNTIQNVSVPTVTAIRPHPDTATGAAMIVLPGGAFGALAWDVEGIEIGQFLAERGITAFVLKYRIRTPTIGVAWSVITRGLKDGISPGRAAAISDARQAVRFVRENAVRLGIDPRRVGMTGFSAGAIATLGTLTGDDAATRPNIAASVYGLDHVENVHPADTSLLIAAADPDTTVADAKNIETVWKNAGAPVETHLFQSGDHGFGLGRPGTDSMRFAGVYDDWLVRQGYARPHEEHSR
ncbi:alpha/beta hydrolase [Microbacterium hominis]|uniref:Dienelactone hydrolase family protein n=1 Tax=Microbacterium hominis TaxID=162426 RepID=A0A7D4QHN3_9MICO|nr:alpha/beta hydrolase [Microbacterium hominis]QKJ18936.1 dienelactone hydrolase family protein [Microbacterium hominis]